MANHDFSLLFRQAPRGHSIFWRQLRPEFVKSYKHKLSPDALSSLAKDGGDGVEHNQRVHEATNILVKTAIPRFADELSLKTEEELSKMDISLEMHKRGINMRHIGLLRSNFWFTVHGPVAVKFGEPRIVSQANHALSVEVKPGYLVNIQGQEFKVADKEYYPNTSYITLEDSPKFSSVGERIR